MWWTCYIAGFLAFAIPQDTLAAYFGHCTSIICALALWVVIDRITKAAAEGTTSTVTTEKRQWWRPASR